MIMNFNYTAKNTLSLTNALTHEHDSILFFDWCVDTNLHV